MNALRRARVNAGHEVPVEGLGHERHEGRHQARDRRETRVQGGVRRPLVGVVFGLVFGWLAVRAGAGLVIGLRAIANVLTSILFWTTPWFYGTVLLSLVMGLARAMDEIGMSAFKPTWGGISSNPNRSSGSAPTALASSIKT